MRHSDTTNNDKSVDTARDSRSGNGVYKDSWTRVYLWEIIKGLFNTLKHILFIKPFTSQYPEEKLSFIPKFRGEHRLKKDEQGRPKCVACFMCATACPSLCISIEAGEAPWADREKYPVKFEIDLLKCIYCGYCEEACPCDAIELTETHYTVAETREEKVYDKERLLEN